MSQRNFAAAAILAISLVIAALINHGVYTMAVVRGDENIPASTIRLNTLTGTLSYCLTEAKYPGELGCHQIREGESWEALARRYKHFEGEP